MPQPKGKTGNPNGSPKGTPNKTITELKKWINKIISDNTKQLARDLNNMEPVERWRVVEKLLPYVIPKQQAVPSDIDFNTLTEEQIDIIINQINDDDE